VATLRPLAFVEPAAGRTVVRAGRAQQLAAVYDGRLMCVTASTISGR